MKQPRKKGRYSHNPINLLHWRIWVIIATIIYCLVASHYGNLDNTYVAEPDVSMKPVVVEPEETIEEKIKRYFPRSHKTMIAVAYAESNLNHDAKNWNCWYNKERTIVFTHKVKGSHSTSCKKEHRKYSWSMDCGVLMKNYIGVKECPKVDIDEHLKEMAQLSEERGFQPWYAWQNNSYKKYLAQN